MNFNIIGSCSLTINHFNNGPVTRSLEICEIPLKSLFGPFNQTISAYIMDVCPPIASSPIDFSAMPHLSELQFADFYDSSQPKRVDILVGFDALYSLLTDEVRRGPAGTPVALGTQFGWALNGPYPLQPSNFSRAQNQVLITQTVKQPSSSPPKHVSDPVVRVARQSVLARPDSAHVRSCLAVMDRDHSEPSQIVCPKRLEYLLALDALHQLINCKGRQNQQGYPPALVGWNRKRPQFGVQTNEAEMRDR